MPPDRITSEETEALSRRRARKNWVVFGLLAAFVVGVFLISFSHVRTETNQSPPTVGSQ